MTAIILIAAALSGLLVGIKIGMLQRNSLEYWRGYDDGEVCGYKAGVDKRRGLEIREEELQ